MNCQEFNDNIYDYCDGSLSPALQSQITGHIGECQVCRNNYHLTMLENEVLSDVSDIPALPIHFTAQLMEALPSNQGLKPMAPLLIMNKNVSRRAKGTAWLSSLIAMAAVIALCIYWPNLTSMFNQTNVAGNYDNLKQPATLGEIPNPGYGNPSQSSTPVSDSKASKQELPETSTAPLADQQSKTNADVNKPVQIAKSEINAVPPVQSSVPTGSEVMKRSTTNEVDRSIRFDSQSADLDLQSLVPQNIPARLKLIPEGNHGEKEIVFNYASQDGKETLQLKLVPYAEIVTATGPMSNVFAMDSIPSVSRDIQVGNKKITVSFSGNMPAAELSKLADTITFKEETLPLKSQP